MSKSSRTFRIFVSSTFSDLKAERNALQRFVFPRLRELCMQHGCRFQAIDLRWGVSEEAGRDQQTVNICLREIERCRAVTPKPNFIVLLGDRYGWRPLPPQIPAGEFETLAALVTDAGLREKLHQWYRRDDNAIPPEYWLQPRMGEYAQGREGRYRWSREVEQPLHQELERAAEEAGLSDEARRKYLGSAVELEIVHGALKVPDASEHVFGFFRKLIVTTPNGKKAPILENLPAEEELKPYLDLIRTGEPDTEAVKRLADLKAEIRRRLPGNIEDYTAQWTDVGTTTDHIGDLPADLKECLKLNDSPNPPKALCADVWRRLSGTILGQIEQIKGTDPLARENADHEAFGNERTRGFVGRADVLSRIASYLDGTDNRPLVIHGRSGSGKTALMAEAASDSAIRNPQSAIVRRFIGATPGSTELRSLLSDLCRGLGVAEVPSDMNELVMAFRDRLSPSEQGESKKDGKAPSENEQGKTVIFLDALDQINPGDNARMLYWMPRDLKPNVKLIVSVLEGERLREPESDKAAQASMAAQIPQSAFRIPHSEDPFDLARRIWPESLVSLGSLDNTAGSDLLDRWLMDAGRALQAPQKQAVLTKFQKEGMPLYLKLAFEEACGWHSYEPAPDLPADTPGLIRFMLERLSQPENHGPLLVARALGYLAAAKNGLTEDELLDVLARDEEYWRDFCDHIRHTEPTLVRTDFADLGVADLKDVPPDQRRLPVIVWSRLYHDMARYLTERSADATMLFFFYHRQLREVIEQTYLQPEDRLRAHERLAEYFAGQDYWAEPLEAQRARAKRLPPTPRPANIRKVVELPYHRLGAAKLGGKDDPTSPYWDKVADLLTDWQFLEAKAEADPYFDAEADRKQAAESDRIAREAKK